MKKRLNPSFVGFGLFMSSIVFATLIGVYVYLRLTMPLAKEPVVPISHLLTYFAGSIFISLFIGFLVAHMDSGILGGVYEKEDGSQQPTDKSIGLPLNSGE